MTSALLATKHQKLDLVGPALAPLGWSIDACEVDTDQVGTFSGIIPRLLPPLETARAKALLARDLGEPTWLLASEGSIEPFGLVFHRDVELVVAVHRESRVLIPGVAVSLEIHASILDVTDTTSDDEIRAFCSRADLPAHHLMVVSLDQSTPPLGALASVAQVFEALDRSGRPDRRLRVMTDYRAHLCPSRRPTIRAAAEDLANRLARRCPRCGEGGFGGHETIAGKPCRGCSRPTLEPLATTFTCPWCDFQDRVQLAGFVDPARCSWCNP